MTTSRNQARRCFEILQCRDGHRRDYADNAGDAHRIALNWTGPGARQVTITASPTDSDRWAVRHYRWHPTDGACVTAWLTWHGDTYVGPRSQPPA